MRSPLTWLPTTLTITALLVVAACGPGSARLTTSPAASTSASGAIDGIVVTDAWVRPPIGPDRPGAGYLTITNTFGQDDALLDVSSPIATSIEIHETKAGDSGMMAMEPVGRIDVPVGASVALEPGGYHLMLMGVHDLPAVGETVELTLRLERTGDIVVEAAVRED